MFPVPIIPQQIVYSAPTLHKTLIPYKTPQLIPRNKSQITNK